MTTSNARLLTFGALLISALLLSIPAAGDGTPSLDVTITQAVQRIDSGAVDGIANVLNWLGQTAPAVALGGLAVLVLAYLHRTFEASVVLAAVAAKSFSPMLKGLFESPRPDGSSVQVIDVFNGFGFPSGHAMGAMLLYGSLFYVAWRLAPFRGQWLVQALAVLMILGTGFSRIYVGAHWPTDVLGGYLWGATFLVAGIAICRTVWAPRTGDDRVIDIGAAFEPKN